MDADGDLVFRALADASRRLILDLLVERDGRTLSELEAAVTAIWPMTRFGVMKHVKVLVEANLVTTRRVGRTTVHHLNPVPIQMIHDRWITKFTQARVAALTELKHDLEGQS
jgi:DNA-binding transcriptional ArsR family regulator